MRLNRLKLENWRGVASREIEFGDGVTIIEGPNEIGKSSLVEALRTLIKELDSSNKQAIKAVQPVGRDVGSSVEADIESGEYAFTYRKTFNRDKQTTLTVTAPSNEQLTGRDAHQRVEQILEETVDLSLWEALLVDQGEKITAVDIQDSAALSKALDEAAGSGMSGDDDTDLFEAVQAEYEKYFTLKSGKSRFAADEKALERLREQVAQLQSDLQAIEADAEKLERLSADLEAREKALPGLEQTAKDYEENWRRIDGLKNELALKSKDLDAVEVKVTQAQKAVDERSALVQSISDTEADIRTSTADIEPKRKGIARITDSIKSAKLVLADLRKKRTTEKDRLSLVEADTRYLRQVVELERFEKMLEELDRLAKSIEDAAGIVAGITIDANGLKALQAAENELRVLKSQRDTAATSLTVTAETPQDFEIGPDKISLRPDATEKRLLDQRTTIRLPGIASVTIEPPDSAADLSGKVKEAEKTFKVLLSDFQVKDREEAAKLFEKKRDAETALESAKQREQELLDDRNRAEIQQDKNRRAEMTSEYLGNRKSETELPATAELAESLTDEARQAVEAVESKVHDAETKADRLQSDLEQAQADIRESEITLRSLETKLEDLRQNLETDRKTVADDKLGSEFESAKQERTAAQQAVDDAKTRLDALDPDSIKHLRDNSIAAYERAKDELNKIETDAAVLRDRLEQSQASGKFEQLEQAERQLDESDERYANMMRRADAAKLLWETINKHRDAARQAYVKPLKDAIERLGRIVFGVDFEVRIGDDWSIEARTLDGKTIQFADLSIGAKEQLGILTRLAAAQIVSRHGGVPLIIDDALGFSDPNRLDTMGAAFSAAGKDSQVVILTCSPGRFRSIGSAQLVQY